MILTEEQRKELDSVCRPLIKWMADNCCPHDIVIVEYDTYVLFEGVCSGGRIDDYIK